MFCSVFCQKIFCVLQNRQNITVLNTNFLRSFIAVFDTPGFFDSDECQNKENKKQIASQIGNKIDMFAYFMTADNKRMDSNIQNVFTILQEWTMGTEQIFYSVFRFFKLLFQKVSHKGNIWSNLVLVYPKFTQTGDEQFQRLLEDDSKPNQLKKSVEDAKEFLINLANEHSWNITSVDEKGIQA